VYADNEANPSVHIPVDICAHTSDVRCVLSMDIC